MTLGYLGLPHLGGMHTVYTSLRKGLSEYGIEVRWLGVGRRAAEAARNPQWVRERKYGMVIGPDANDEFRQATILKDFLESGAVDGVFVNVLWFRVVTNAMRYVSSDVRKIMIVHNITPGTYEAARSIRDYIHAAVGVSPRIGVDLVRKAGFASDCTFTIPNAVDMSAFRQKAHRSMNATQLRLLALGRVVDSQKGVFWLPKILERLWDLPVRLTVAGDGPDLEELKKRCSRLGERVQFIGPVAPECIPEVMANHDVLVFPSRFEGLGVVLVEAMAGGCVPVASRIRGVTDFVVEEGKEGFLFDIGDTRAAAMAIRSIWGDRERLGEMSQAGVEKAGGQFGLQRMSEAYLGVIASAMSEARKVRLPLPLSKWSYPRGLRRGVRSYLPAGVKNWLRGLSERAL